jgi:hypothetical protein
VPLTVNPTMVNPQDVSLAVQAAIKNMATQAVFYFTIPVNLEALFARPAAMDIAAFGTAWKSMDESHEASIVVNGKITECSSCSKPPPIHTIPDYRTHTQTYPVPHWKY